MAIFITVLLKMTLFYFYAFAWYLEKTHYFKPI